MELVNLPVKTTVGAVRDLVISAEILRPWNRRAGQDHPVPEKTDIPPEVANELRELRKKVREQEEVIQVLEKATAAFFRM